MSIYGPMRDSAPLSPGTIALRDDLTLLVSVNDCAIELQLDADTARDLSVALLAKLLALRPDIAPRLAEQLWQVATDCLTDGQISTIVEPPPQPGPVEPIATR